MNTLIIFIKDRMARNQFLEIRKLVSIVAFIFISTQGIFAQFTDGQIITIQSDYSTSKNYLSANSRGDAITNPNTHSLNCLWKVHTNPNNTNQYCFESVAFPGRYINNSSNKLALTISNNTPTNNSYFFKLTDNNTRLQSVSSSKYYFRYNSGWSLSTSSNPISARNLLFETYTYTPDEGEVTMSIDPPSKKFPLSGGSQNFTVNIIGGGGTFNSSTTNNSIPTTSFWAGGVTLEYSVNNDIFQISNTSTTGVTITVDATTQQITGTLTATAKINDETVATVRATLSTSLSLSFAHKKGASGRALIDNGKGIMMQGVHEQRQVIYMNAGDSRQLLLPQQSQNYMDGYIRWYNYDTDAKIATGFSKTNGSKTFTDAVFGLYTTGTSSSKVGNPGIATYTMPSTVAPITIACDVSQYGDYTNTGGIFTEPTLSYRMIYEIRPASEMVEMLTPCTGDKFFEERNIIAPADVSINIGPQYKYVGSANSSYYYNNNSTLTQITSATWYKNGNIHWVLGAPADFRMITISGTAGTTDVYTLVGEGHNIVKLNITFKDVANNGNTLGIGPMHETNGTAIINNATLKEKYTLLTSRDFDYQDGGTGNLYPNPLPWQEMSYGFTYTGTGSPTKLRLPGFADQSEYALIRNTANLPSDVDWLQKAVENKSGTNNGYFVYIDAGLLPGIVADLSVDGDLCPGATLAFSCWINNLGTGTNPTPPNLNFILTGVSNGEVKELECFTTGNVSSDADDRGKWHQVFYEFTLSEEKYEEYRLQIYNNGTNSTGNDFGIDEIRIYTKKLPNRSTQAMVDCSADDGVHTAILAIDYMSPAYKEIVWTENVTEATFFYQWQEENGNVVNINNYLNMAGLSDGYGKITLDKWQTGDDAPGTVYSNLATFFAQEGTPDETTFFYVMESLKDANGDDEIRPVLYIVQRSAMFTVGNTYYSAVAESAEGLGRADCNTRSSFTVRQPVNVVIDDGGLGLSTNTLCAGNKYTVRTQLFASDVDGNVVEGYCLSDWYTGRELTQTEVDKINENLKLFRGVYKDANTFEKTVSGTYTQEVKTYLLDYKNYFMLATKDVEIAVPEAGQPLVYYIFPIKETAAPLSTSDTGEFIFCTEPPVRAEFKGVALAKYGDVQLGNLPPEIEDKIPNVRVSKNTEIITIPVYDSNLADEDGDVHGSIDEFIIYESTDPAYNSDKTYVLEVQEGILSSGNSLKLKAKATGNTLELKEGYTYSFYGNIDTDENFGDCSVRATYFNLLVVPEVVVWSPQGDNSSWNNDNNWKTTDGRSGFVPLATTDVILKTKNANGDIVTWPTLVTTSNSPEDNDYHTLGAGATNYITYDVHYAKNACKNIYLEPGAKLVNQHALNYEKAFVDMKVDLYRWVMLAPPLKDMYAGDFFIPKNGYSKQEGFEDDGSIFYSQSTPPDHRRYEYPNWQSIYGKSSLNIAYENMDGYPINYGNDGWLDKPTNYLAEKYNPGTGLGIWAEDRVQTGNWKDKKPVTFRFPKTQTSYYYYNDNDAQMSEYASTSRGSNNAAFKFAFEPNATDTNGDPIMKVTINNDAEGSVFLVGNPFMADLSLAAFLAQNPHLSRTVRIFTNNGEDYEGVNPPIGDETVILETGTKTSEGIYALSEGNQELKTWIQPMRSFLVELAKGTSKTLKVIFTPEMAGFVYDTDTEALRSNVNKKKRDRLTISVDWEGNNSKTMIAFNDKTSTSYDSKEDALLYSGIFQNSTPAIAAYSVADNKALSINLIPKEESIMIPLGLMVNPKQEQDVYASWTFSGLDGINYDLYLLDTKTGEHSILKEDTQLDLETPTNSQRYFIVGNKLNDVSIPSVEIEDSSKSNVKISQEGTGKAVIYSTDKIKEYSFFNIFGQLIKSENNINQSVCSVSQLTTGIYIVNVITETSSTTLKVIIN
ncbi:hypothetical protein M2138_000753 [Dysgonomonadaceae bacterium PH5-43]|nr:hypothetical protein [Dysgonomonadaceae bacterium PH5-43]